jgi:hypothetical protein
MRDEFRSGIDDEIDDVARALTGVSPPGDFRALIQFRLTERRRDALNGRLYGAVAATAAIIGLIIALLSHKERPTTSIPRENVVTETTVNTQLPLVASPRPVPVVVPVPAERYQQAGRVPAPVAVLDEPTSITDPVTVESLELPPLDVDEVDVPALSVETLQIDPVSFQ